MVFHHACLPVTIIIYRAICLSTPSIFLLICLINRTIMPYTFCRFHFFHETLHRLYIHICLFQRTYPVLRYNLVPYFRILYAVPYVGERGNFLWFAQKHTRNTSCILSMAIARPSYATLLSTHGVTEINGSKESYPLNTLPKKSFIHSVRQIHISSTPTSNTRL